uniref:Putative secreted protein n=1 Tax=Anopheles darlingi TaxID=43151 RepID=A0A2M4DI42_ANODA
MTAFEGILLLAAASPVACRSPYPVHNKFGKCGVRKVYMCYKSLKSDNKCVQWKIIFFIEFFIHIHPKNATEQGRRKHTHTPSQNVDDTHTIAKCVENNTHTCAKGLSRLLEVGSLSGSLSGSLKQ